MAAGCNFPARTVFYRETLNTPVQSAPAKPAGPAEFTIFMRAYQDMVFSIAARLTGNDRQAEDIAQDVFLKAYEHFPQLRGNVQAGGWLQTVTTRLTLNHLTRYRKRWRLFSDWRRDADGDDGTSDDLTEPDIPVPDTLLADLDQAERWALLERALAALPEHQRLPLVLYHFEALSYEDISGQLKVSLAKVKTDIHRARAALVRAVATTGPGKSRQEPGI